MTLFRFIMMASPDESRLRGGITLPQTPGDGRPRDTRIRPVRAPLPRTRLTHTGIDETFTLAGPGSGHHEDVNENTIATAAMVVTSALLTMSIVSGIIVFEFYSVIAMFLAGSLMGQARQAKRH